MAIPQIIKKAANDIRTKIKGKEVRESLAKGIEESGSIANESNSRSKDTDFRQGVVETQFDDVLAGWSDYKPVDNAETIAARTNRETGENFDTVGERLDQEGKRKTTQITEHESRLNDDYISPDNFEGNDYYRVQLAIQQALDESKSIKLSRLYDLTSYPALNILKNVNDRRPIYFVGHGGGLQKHDSGFMFSSELRNVGDLFFDKVEFRSTEGTGSKVFDADHLIRIENTGCTFRDVDTIAEAVERYFQTLKFIGGSVTGGKGFAFETPSVYDFLVTGGFFAEHRDSFFKQTPRTVGTYSQRLHGARFTDIMVEGLRKHAFYFRNTEGLKIDGLFLESNSGEDLVFDPDGYFEGVDISNIRAFYGTSTSRTEIIKWGGQLVTAETSNNISRNVPIHNTTNVQSGSLLSSNDRGATAARDLVPNIDPNNRILDLTSVGIKRGNKSVTTTYPHFKRLQAEVSRTLSLGQHAEFEVLFDEPVYRDDLISIQCFPGIYSQEVSVEKYYRDSSDGSVRVWVKHSGTVDNLKVTLFVTVLRFSTSVIG